MRIITILVSTMLLCGCSLIPKLNFNTPSTTPKAINRSKVKDVCRGEIVFNRNGGVASCSKGYYTYAENYKKEERKLTLKERILNFFSNLVGWSFWIVVGLLIICPSLVGVIVGKIIESIWGIGSKTLRSTVRAIQRTRNEDIDLTEALAIEQDSDVKKFIRKLKDKEKIK